MKTLKELKEERDALVSKSDAIVARIDEAVKAGKEADPADLADFNELTEKKTGLIAKNQAEIERLNDIEERRNTLALAKSRAAEAGTSFVAQIDTGVKPQETIAQHVCLPTKAFANTNEGKQQAYACGMWLRATLARHRGGSDPKAEAHCERMGYRIRNTMTEGTTTAGGYTVPDPLSAAFIEYRQKVAVLRPLVDVRQMTSDTLAVPKVSGGQTIYYPGEATAITASDMSFAQVALSAVKRAALGYVSRELRDDSLINIVDEWVSRVSYEFAKQEDNEGINGDSTSTYGGETGILAAIGSAGVSTAATGHDTWPELDMADVTAWLGKLPSQHAMNQAIVCSRSFYMNVLYRLLVSAGGNDAAMLQAFNEGNAMFLGIKCHLTDRMPTATGVATVCALYGNFAEAGILGDRKDLSVEMSEHYAFNADLLTLRGTTRYDWNWHNVGDSSNAGAVVALKTAS